MQTLPLKLRTVVGRSARPLSGDFLVSLVIEVIAPNEALALPLNLHLMIDVSTSMAGEKLNCVKEACHQILGALKPDDIASISSFSTESRVVFAAQAMTAEAKVAAKRAIDLLKPEGVTLLGAGLETAFSEVKRFHAGDQDATLKTSLLILLSDGFPTTASGERVTDLAPFFERIERHIQSGVLLSTVGLGNAAHYDKDFLIALAERGNGSFKYASTSLELMPLLIEEFQKFQKTVISQYALKLDRVEGKIHRFCRVAPEIKLFDPPVLTDGSAMIPCGAIQRGMTQVYLLDLVTGSAPLAGQRRICTLSPVAGMISGQSHTVTVEYTDEESKISQPMLREVEEWIDQLQIFITQGKIEKTIKTGDLKRTHLLIQNAKQITKRLGEIGKTKLLDEIASKIDSGQPLSEHELTQAKLASKKTKVLTDTSS